MLKKLKSTLIINAIGFGLLMVCLYGYQGIKTNIQSENHESIVVDESALKERLAQCSDSQLKKMLVAGEEIKEWNAILQKTGSHVVDQVLKGQGIFT